MRAPGPLLAVLALCGAVAAWRPPAAPAPTVTVEGPTTDTLPDITPTFLVRSAGFDPTDEPVSLRLLIATDSQFTHIVADTTVLGDSAVITLTRPLPDTAGVYWRATARGLGGTLVSSAVTGPRIVPRWLRLVAPNVPTGVTLSTPRPTFVWTSARVASPPGPWTYTFELLRSSDRQPRLTARGLIDTTYTPGFDLDLNSSYRWRVTARLSSGDSIRLTSAASFVIVDPRRPVATLLYQNFPNPFPSATSASTCIWFDLRDPAVVRLDIFDIRANLVRRMIPGPGLPAEMPSGRYGRAVGDPSGGCDPRFAWDGTADDGTIVGSGVYLVRLTANGRTLFRRAVFRGR